MLLEFFSIFLIFQLDSTKGSKDELMKSKDLIMKCMKTIFEKSEDMETFLFYLGMPSKLIVAD